MTTTNYPQLLEANIPADAHDPNTDPRLQEELDKLWEEELRQGVKLSYYSLADLRKTSFNYETLLPPFLPRVGVGAVVGMPDSGKSMLCRQLALSVALRKGIFCGMPLITKHHHAIFITTEDTIESTKQCFTRQANAMTNPKPNFEENLKIMIADDLSTDEILSLLEDILRKHPTDLVVIDAYGDVFKGGEGNSNIQNRNSVRPFSRLARAYETCIIFVHHTNKTARNYAPDQVHVQGGSGFVQKVRSILELRTMSGSNTKFLTCVKGNYTSSEKKSEAIKLVFDPETFLYKDTGERMPIEYITSEKTNRSKLDLKPSDVFRGYEKTATTAEIIKRVVNKTKCSERTAERWMNATLKQIERGVYENPNVTS